PSQHSPTWAPTPTPAPTARLTEPSPLPCSPAVTARALTAEQLENLEGSIKQAMGTNVAIEAQVDESLLGGLIVKVGSRMVDTSLKTKLTQLRLAMKGVG
ncbi:MAG: F0F1 ATP synthase subunit delta, partial [Magnetovibrio sp.]|nr:F0F1 ATP synthase subunit delta [Magnetovibrio sp.]